jgi:outer membrane lipoprotein-sorting protein
MDAHGNLSIRPGAGAVIAVLLLFTALVARAQTDGLVDRWIASQTNLHTWSADLIQTRAIKTLSQPLVSAGKIWIAVPDRFRWELGQPAQTIALRQADQLLIVYPRLKRVEKYPLKNSRPGPWKDALALLEAAFPRSRADLEAQFDIRSVTETNSVACLSLEPRSGLARKFVTGLQICFRADDFSPVSTALTFTDGSSMRNDFTNAVSNPVLRPELFAMEPAPDYSIVEPLKQ